MDELLSSGNGSETDILNMMIDSSKIANRKGTSKGTWYEIA